MKDTQFVKIAKALADPTRHKILREVRAAGEMTCKQVCERFPLSQPTISHHICSLAEAGLFKVDKRGQFHILSVDHAVLDAFIQCLGTDAPSTTSSPAPAPKPRARQPKAKA